MSTRRAQIQSNDVLTTRQKLCLFHGTDVTCSEAIAITDEDITTDFLRRKSVSPNKIIASGIGPLQLKRMGATEASCLIELGFDALHLTDEKFSSEANAAYGSEAVRVVFLQSASDAVAIAGSSAVDILAITNNDLLDACAGSPVEAEAVLQQLPAGRALSGVSPQTLLNTGVRRQKLSGLGYSLTSIISQTHADPSELIKLGYVK